MSPERKQTEAALRRAFELSHARPTMRYGIGIWLRIKCGGVKVAHSSATQQTDTAHVTWWDERIHPEENQRVTSGIYAVIDSYSGRMNTACAVEMVLIPTSLIALMWCMTTRGSRSA